MKNNANRYEAILAALVLTTGLGLSIGNFLELQAIAKERLYLALEKNTYSQVEQFQTNLSISLDSLSNVADLYSLAGNISPSQLKKFFHTDTHYHTGTLGLAWLDSVAHDQIHTYEAKVQQSGDLDFSIFEVTGHGIPRAANDRSEYFPIRSMYPNAVGEFTVGLNVASIPSRFKVMNKAKQTKNTTVTHRLSIFDGSHQRTGFQAYHPIFSHAEQVWQQQLLGYVVGVYDFSALFESVFNDSPLTIALYDSASTSQQLLYSTSAQLSTVSEVQQEKSLHWTFPISVADKQWLMVVFPDLSSAATSTNWLAYVGLFIGGLITLLLTGYLFIALMRSRQVTELSLNLAGTNNQLEIQRQLKQEADKANHAKSQLLRAASHDLRQPIHTMGLLVSLLKNAETEQERTQLIDKSTRALNNMNDMFSALLDISLLDSGNLTVNKAHFYVQERIDNLAIEFDVAAQQKSLLLDVIPTSAVAYTDPALLERIIRNLLSNAIRYTETGRVLIGCRRLKKHIRICVIDTGMGLNKKSQSKLFDEFYRDDKAQQVSNQGLGLGLSIVQKTAELLGLTIGFKSELEKGSCFYIDVDYGELFKSQHNREINVAQLSVTVWIIEDDPDMRFGLENLLQSWGCKIMSFDSSQTLASTLTDELHRPDCIISDYQLVNETSLILVSLIRDTFNVHIPTLILTGTTESAIRQQVEQAGCDYMMKPAQPEALYQWISDKRLTN